MNQLSKYGLNLIDMPNLSLKIRTSQEQHHSTASNMNGPEDLTVLGSHCFDDLGL